VATTSLRCLGCMGVRAPNCGRSLTTEAHAVVRAAILRVDLSGVGDEDARDGRLERKDAAAIPDLWYRLRCFFAKRPCAQDVVLVEGRRDPLECRYDILRAWSRSEEHTSELQSRREIVCRLLLEKKKSRSGSPRCSLCVT